MSEREVVLTGLPRHDNLRDMASGKEKDIILVTPTWRKDLTTAPLMSGQPRAFFTSDHGYRKGYFSYDDDGFGPVVEDADSAFSELKNALCGEEDTIYAARRLAFFPYHDGKCCERVAKAIEGL